MNATENNAKNAMLAMYQMELAKNLPNNSWNAHNLSTYKEAARLCGATDEEIKAAQDGAFASFPKDVKESITKKTTEAARLWKEERQLQYDADYSASKKERIALLAKAKEAGKKSSELWHFTTAELVIFDPQLSKFTPATA